MMTVSLAYGAVSMSAGEYSESGTRLVAGRLNKTTPTIIRKNPRMKRHLSWGVSWKRAQLPQTPLAMIAPFRTGTTYVASKCFKHLFICTNCRPADPTDSAT